MNKYLLTTVAAVVLCATLVVVPDFTAAAADQPESSLTSETLPEAGAGARSTDAEAVPADTIYPISPERRVLLNDYSRLSQIWSVAISVFEWLVLLAIALTGLSRAMLTLAERITGRQWLQFLLYTLILVALLSAVTLPLEIYRDFVVEHRYGFSNQTFGEWLLDWAKEIPILFLVMALIFGFFYFLVRKYPRRWWLAFSVGAIPFIILMFVVVPVVVAPMFNDFKSLPTGPLRTEISELAARAGITGADIFEVDASRQSTKLSAYVTGLFSSKRIVLYDTIINAFTVEELAFVVGHEMGHYVMHHVWWSVATIVVLLLFSTWLASRFLPPLIKKYQLRLGFDRIASYASFPIVLCALSFVLFFTQPVSNGVSRYKEREADRFGLELSMVSGETAAVAFEKLSAYNLSDPNPNALVEFWFYDHPALQKRIDFVRSCAAQRKP